MNFRFIETIVQDIEADSLEEAKEQFSQHSGFTESLHVFDENGTLVYSEESVDQDTILQLTKNIELNTHGGKNED